MDKIRSAKDLEPLITYYVKEMGEQPGKLMMVLSLLKDLEQLPAWKEEPEQVQISIKIALELLADLFHQMGRSEGGGQTAENLAFSDDDLDALFRGER